MAQSGTPDASAAAARDLVGYGRRLPDPQWPGGARLAINFNLNFEAGGESTLLNGDDRSESVLNDIGFPALVGKRAVLVESAFEYGSRRGVWRVLRLFRERGLKVSVLAVASALAHTREVVQAMLEDGHEIVSHGWRWIDYAHVPEAVERQHIGLAVEAIRQATGRAPVGWMTGRPSVNTRRLLAGHGGFLYDRDALNDELPYWLRVDGRPHLVVPYSFETNDNRFDSNSGFNTADDFFQYMRDTFDMLYQEGADEPKMMSVALHDRLIGRPGRAVGLARFLDHILAHEHVWVATGEEIARHWIERYPPP